MHPFTRSAVLPFLAGALMSPAGAEPSYEIVELGTLGGSTSQALAVAGERVFGYATTEQGVKRPAVWGTAGIEDLGAPPGFVVAEAVAGNAAGQTVVLGEGSPQSYRSFLLEDGTYTDIGQLEGRAETLAADMDGNGRVVGLALTLGGGNSAAFLWDSGVMHNLGTLGGSTARAHGINDGGQVVGRSQAGEVGGIEPSRAFLWEEGVMSNLGVLPGREESQAFDVNEQGDVVGSSWTVLLPSFLSEDWATLWRANGDVVDLGRTPLLGGVGFYTDNIARAINDLGQVVGDAAFIASGASKAAFLWENGVNYNLNDLVDPGSGWDLLSARGINDEGEIVGFGIAPGGTLEAFLLRPSQSPVAVPPGAELARLQLTAAPSPFRSTLRIGFVLSAPGRARLAIYDVRGRLVRELVDEHRSAGAHEVSWRDASPGTQGVYFLRLDAGGIRETRKLVRAR